MTASDRINDIVNGPFQITYSTGWALLALGLVVGITWQQAQIFMGQPARYGVVVVRAVIAAIAMSVYPKLCMGIWNIALDIGNGIYTDASRATLGAFSKWLTVQATASIFKDGVILAPISLVRNGILQLLMTCTTVGVSFAIDALQIAQVCVFSVVYAFGPIALGLYVFGFKTGEYWLTALLEICSWTVTMAIVQSTLAVRAYSVMVFNAGQAAYQFEWWDAMKEITFLGMMIFCVPVITSRFLGFAALGEIGRVTLGSSNAAAIASTLQSWGSWGATPQTATPTTQGSGSDRRAGD